MNVSLNLPIKNVMRYTPDLGHVNFPELTSYPHPTFKMIWSNTITCPPCMFVRLARAVEKAMACPENNKRD